MSKFKGYTKDWDTKTLDVPIPEIVHEYRLAADKNAQIDILADLCGVKPCRIAWILERCGLKVDPKKMPREPRDPAREDPRRKWEASSDAKVCDGIRKQLEELAEEELQKARERAQSMDGFDMPDEEPAGDAGESVVESVVGNEESVAEAMESVGEMGGSVMEEIRPFETEKMLIRRLEAAVEKCDEPDASEAGRTVGADLRREILIDASVCVCSDRNRMYGEPEDNFAVIAKFWSDYLGVPVTAGDAVNMMILFKVARIATAEKPSRDSYVDIAGYAACGGGMIK